MKVLGLCLVLSYSLSCFAQTALVSLKKEREDEIAYCSEVQASEEVFYNIPVYSKKYKINTSEVIKRLLEKAERGLLITKPHFIGQRCSIFFDIYPSEKWSVSDWDAFKFGYKKKLEKLTKTEPVEVECPEFLKNAGVCK